MCLFKRVIGMNQKSHPSHRVNVKQLNKLMKSKKKKMTENYLNTTSHISRMIQLQIYIFKLCSFVFDTENFIITKNKVDNVGICTEQRHFSQG